ncbi:MAG TPA: excisionase family DNA-binding protein [Bacteroidota bacterium]|nr:excisionase family DNA-binding protein [Bacteroidota bacterium]
MAEMVNRWLSVDKTGRYLGVGSDTVYHWSDRFAMPAYRMGRLWKFKAGGAADRTKRDSGE